MRSIRRLSPCSPFLVRQLCHRPAGPPAGDPKGRPGVWPSSIPSPARSSPPCPEGGVTGHEVIASPDGRLAYVPIYGNSGVGKPGTDGTQPRRHRHRRAKGRRQPRLRPRRPPAHAHSSDPKTACSTSPPSSTSAITLIDPKTLKIVGSIPTGQPESHMLALSHDGRRGYTANVGPGTVSVLDIQARKTLTIIPISANTQRISISNDDRWVFTADQTKPRLAVIDTATNQVKNWIPLDGFGYGSAPTPDGRWLLIAIPDKNKVAVIDLKTMQVARSVSVGEYSAGGAGPPRRQRRLRLLHGQQPSSRNRPCHMEGHAPDRHRQGDGWAGLGSRASGPIRPADRVLR